MKTKTFIIGVREVHVQPVKVEARDYKEAVRKIENGEGVCLEDRFSYSHTLDSEYWTDETED